MPSADEYRQFADECFRWAREAKDDEKRKTFLDMARAWTQAAAMLEPVNGVVPPAAIIQPLDGDGTPT